MDKCVNTETVKMEGICVLRLFFFLEWGGGGKVENGWISV